MCGFRDALMDTGQTDQQTCSSHTPLPPLSGTGCFSNTYNTYFQCSDRLFQTPQVSSESVRAVFDGGLVG